MGFSLEDWKQFVTDCEDTRKNWLKAGEQSWKEINRKQRSNALWNVNPNSAKKKQHYPLWWTTFKIRQSLVYARTPLFIGKDKTGGDDPVGRTAAICHERLANNLVEACEYDSTVKASRDDFLATDFGAARVFYECTYREEPIKIRVVEQVDEMTGAVMMLDDKGAPVSPDMVRQDEDGPYIEGTEEVEVETERVYTDHVLYTDMYVDPDARSWTKSRRIAFGYDYTRSEFKEVFGSDAIASLSNQSFAEVGKQRKLVRVYEAWDSYEREVVWFAENGTEFLKPKVIKSEAAEEGETASEEEKEDPYSLEKFFPCPKPLLRNAPTTDFWPVPEYYQLQDILEDVHNIFSRMYTATRAIRVRLLFDNSVSELQALINEAGESDAIGVTNLAQSLAGGQGRLDNLVAYLPIAPMVEGLQNLYQALENRLVIFARCSGTSDLLQGLTDGVERTFGEQQLKAKFAMNQLAEPQAEMQRFARDLGELMCEVALKKFKDETLAQYIVPATLDPEDKERYPAALELLKNDRKRRFRLELETDSTIALNEEYDKAMKVELANTLSAALEKVASIATSNPTLAVAELKLLKHLAKGFRQGKLFEDEIQRAIDDAIAKFEAQSQAEPPPNVDMINAELNKAKLSLDQQKAANDAQLEAAKLQRQDVKEAGAQQLALQELYLKNTAAQQEGARLLQEREEAVAMIQLKVQELTLQRERLALDAQKAGNDSLISQLGLELEKQIANSNAQLKQLEISIKEQKGMLEEREKYLTEQRLQFESQIKALEAGARSSQQQQPQAAQLPPIVVNVDAKKSGRKIARPIRDAAGDIVSVETIEMPLEEV